MPSRVHDLLVIGNGPAGVGAAVQAGICGLTVLVVGEGRTGGRLALARRVENFPGPSAGRNPSGRKICRRLENWLASRKVPVSSDFIFRVDHAEGSFRARGRKGGSYNSKAVIIATGVRPRHWKAPRGTGDGMRVAANWREVPTRRGLLVAVIGGGEAAFDQACSLAERGIGVIILMRGAKPRAYKGLAAEASKLGVRVYGNMPVESVARCPDGGALLSCGGRKFRCDYLLPAVGHRPQLPGISRSARARRGRGLWLAGDVREPLCRQAAVAFGDGVRSAMLAWEFLRKGRG